MTLAHWIVLLIIVLIVAANIFFGIQKIRSRLKFRLFLENNASEVFLFHFKEKVLRGRSRYSSGRWCARYSSTINGVECQYYLDIEGVSPENISLNISKNGDELLTEFKTNQNIFNIV